MRNIRTDRDYICSIRLNAANAKLLKQFARRHQLTINGAVTRAVQVAAAADEKCCEKTLAEDKQPEVSV